MVASASPAIEAGIARNFGLFMRIPPFFEIGASALGYAVVESDSVPQFPWRK
jgi:hypothetical protein